MLAPGEQPTGRALRTGEAQRDVTMGVRRGDGALVWVTADAVPLRGADGAPGGVVTALVDVTAEHEAAAELRRSQDAFRLLAEQSGDVVARMDMENRYVYVSPACERVYGWRPEEMLGRLAFDFIHPDDVPARQRLRLELLDGREAATSEFRVLARRRGVGAGARDDRAAARQRRRARGAPAAPPATCVAAGPPTRRCAGRPSSSPAPSRTRRSGWPSWASTGASCASTGRSATWWATPRTTCWPRTFQDITHAEDLDADLALIEEVIAGRPGRATRWRSATCGPTAG